MPLTTNLDEASYFDDYDPTKDYYKVLFKPGVAVQVRELNQLQTMLQNQIEQFGDNILTNGTIVAGCNFTYNPNLSYVKLIDVQGDGNPVNVNNYNNFIATGSITGLTAYITNTVSGFVSSNPDLNTLYVNYTNGNDTSNTFVPNETLKISDTNNSIWEVDINNGSSGFSNTDTMVFVSAITVANTLGGNAFSNSSSGSANFSVGQVITGVTSNASLTIYEVNTTINATSLVLKVKPSVSQLSNGTANVLSWTLSNGENIFVTNGVQYAQVTSIIGENAQGSFTTDSSGAILTTAMINRGEEYYCPPYTSIISTTGAISTLNLSARNYLATVNVASVTNATGFAYAFGVSNGVIYQKGYFSRVNPQTVVVTKYSNVPDQVSIGFDTLESIANASIDSSLYDNAIGSPNETAPGADRLQLTPTLVVVPTVNAQANSDFFSIVEFSNGYPYIQRNHTQYNEIEAEMASREFDTSGNFVVTPFNLSTVSPSIQNNESFGFNMVISPGAGYLNGFKIETDAQYSQGVNKGIDTVIRSNNAMSINYGNYIRINNIGGMFQFQSGDVISLYDTACNFLGSAAKFGAAISTSGLGNLIGTARIRSLIYEGGADAGLPGAIYRLYLFDISINQGKNFGATRSVFYNNATTGKGVADIVTDLTLNNGAVICKLHNPTSAKNQLVVRGITAMKNANTINYTYRTIRSSNCNTSGIISMQLTNPGETFPYPHGAALLPTDVEDIIVFPTANAVAVANAAGTISCNTTSNIISGSGTSLTSFAVGDYIQIYNGGGSTIRRLTSITNAISATIDSNCSFANTTASFATVLPANIMIPIATRPARSANIDSTGTLLTINLGNTFLTNTSVNMAFNVNVANAQPYPKVSTRGVSVYLQANTNAGNTVGPWLLGAPDIFRLRGVWLGSNTTFTANTGTNVTTNFFIDHNQNKDYYDLGYLYIKPTSNYIVPTNGVLLVEFDCYQQGAGTGFGFDINSYPIDDTQTFSQLISNNAVNTLEIPEFYGSTSEYFDLRDVFDFRPRVKMTANVSSIVTNPSYPSTSVAFGNTADPNNDKKFPLPQSSISATMERYTRRTDLVVINSNSNFQVIKGNPSGVPKSPPQNTIVVGYMEIPPYPSLPQVFSTDLSLIADVGIASNKFTYNRLSKYAISQPTTESSVFQRQPMGYTMEEIGTLQSRIKNLEYYMGLTLQAQAIASSVIPSSNDPSQNRFKFGYFVDDFKTRNYSDVNNPEYNATIVNHQLTAKKDHLNIQFDYEVPQPSKVAVLPYTNYTVISQKLATAGDSSSNNPPPVYDGTLHIEPEYFSVISQIVRSGDGKDNLTVEGGPWTSTVNFTVRNGVLVNYITNNSGIGSSDGKTLKGVTQTNQVINFANSSVTVDPNDAPSLAQLAQALDAGWRGAITPLDGNQYVSGDRVFHLNITGLRPNTIHKFYFGGNDMSNSCIQEFNPDDGINTTTSIGTPLKSTAKGQIKFKFFYTSPITAELANNQIQWSDALVYRSYMSKLAGLQKIAVTSADGLSYATGTVDAIGVYGPNGTVPWFVDEHSANGTIWTPDYTEGEVF
jgi:hypothetical protein